MSKLQFVALPGCFVTRVDVSGLADVNKHLDDFAKAKTERAKQHQLETGCTWPEAVRAAANLSDIEGAQMTTRHPLPAEAPTSDRTRAEQLIAGLMVEREMSRDEAVVAIITEDARERRFGRPPLVSGPPLSEVYRVEMEASDVLDITQASKVVSYLLGVSIETAAHHLHGQIEAGEIETFSLTLQ